MKKIPTIQTGLRLPADLHKRARAVARDQRCTIYFDIETGPLPDNKLVEVMPRFDAPSNWKDPEKIAAEIERKKEEWKQGAALSALTGEVLVIGLHMECHGGIPSRIHIAQCQDSHCTEKTVLRTFWDYFTASHLAASKWVGFNIFGFDLPFLIRRSWANGVPVPDGVRSQGRWWSPRFLDLREVWQLGDRQASGGLDAIARMCGLAGKNGDGAGFADLFRSDRGKALEYLNQDLDVTISVAKALILRDVN